MILPTIGPGGTPKPGLLSALVIAKDATETAIGALKETAPNARDYQGRYHDLEQAENEHRSRLFRLQAVSAELEELAIAIDQIGE